MRGARPGSFSPFRMAEDPAMRGGLPALTAWSAVSASGRAPPTVEGGGRAGPRRLPSWTSPRRSAETGQLVQVDDDAGQHPEHAVAVERDGCSRLAVPGLAVSVQGGVHRGCHCLRVGLAAQELADAPRLVL